MNIPPKEHMSLTFFLCGSSQIRPSFIISKAILLTWACLSFAWILPQPSLLPAVGGSVHTLALLPSGAKLFTHSSLISMQFPSR